MAKSADRKANNLFVCQLSRDLYIAYAGASPFSVCLKLWGRGRERLFNLDFVFSIMASRSKRELQPAPEAAPTNSLPSSSKNNVLNNVNNNHRRQTSVNGEGNGAGDEEVEVRDERDEDESVVPDDEDLKDASGRTKLRSIMLVVTCTTAMILNVSLTSIPHRYVSICLIVIGIDIFFNCSINRTSAHRARFWSRRRLTAMGCLRVLPLLCVSTFLLSRFLSKILNSVYLGLSFHSSWTTCRRSWS